MARPSLRVRMYEWSSCGVSPMVRKGRSPRITHLSWGRIEVEGGRTFKDAKLWPGGVREWDWKETGTRHRPGVQPADVEELLERGAEVMVLSKGILQALQVCPGILELLRTRHSGARPADPKERCASTTSSPRQSALPVSSTQHAERRPSSLPYALTRRSMISETTSSLGAASRQPRPGSRVRTAKHLAALPMQPAHSPATPQAAAPSVAWR